MTSDVPVTPPSRTSRIFLCLLALGFSGFFIYLYIDSTAGMTADKAGTQLPGLLMMLGFVLLALGGAWYALNRRALTLTDTELIVRAGFYGRTLPRASLRLDAALELSLVDRRELGPRWRTNGVALPGYRAGWFRLRNNEKALILLTDPFRVTYLPTTAGYVLLVSTTALLPALRESAATPVVPAAPRPA